MPPADLRSEVEQAIPRVDLSSPEGESIGVRQIHAGLTRDRDAIAGLGSQASLSLPEKAGRVRESRDGPIEASL
jgi:hypothetical protein